MEAADRHLDAGGAEPAGDVHGPRKLVGLDPDQAHQARAAGPLEAPDDLVDRDHRVGLVVGVEDDVDVGSELAPLDHLERQAVEAGQRVRGDPGFPPLDDVAVVVVVGRFDQLDVKRPPPRRAGCAHG
jgi:hypothetical protein